MSLPTLMLETASGEGIVAGIDEAGCGPLAGPVVAAAFVFLSHPAEPLAGLIDDSKRLTAEKRDAAYAALADAARGGLVAYAAAAASAAEIGRLNIRRATHLAMARALMPEPSVLLLDEPSAGLAPLAVSQVFETVADINRSGVTIVMIEQNARRALALADRGYVLESGTNRFEGTGEALLADPQVAELYLGGVERGRPEPPPPEPVTPPR